MPENCRHCYHVPEPYVSDEDNETHPGRWICMVECSPRNRVVSECALSPSDAYGCPNFHKWDGLYAIGSDRGGCVALGIILAGTMHDFLAPSEIAEHWLGQLLGVTADDLMERLR